MADADSEKKKWRVRRSERRRRKKREQKIKERVGVNKKKFDGRSGVGEGKKNKLANAWTLKRKKIWRTPCVREIKMADSSTQIYPGHVELSKQWRT